MSSWDLEISVKTFLWKELVQWESPNDSAFIIHHTMTDCVFDEWLKCHLDEEYPNVLLTFSTKGHQDHSYMIPFFPLYTNADMFKPAANNFGYYCDLPNITTDTGNGAHPNIQLTLFTWLNVIFITLALSVILKDHAHCRILFGL